MGAGVVGTVVGEVVSVVVVSVGTVVVVSVGVVVIEDEVSVWGTVD